jgi:hypothetical protein
MEEIIPNVLNVLSWNICFGCMYANEKSKFDVTAKVVAEYCKSKNTSQNPNDHECLNNVVEFMNREKYDLIGLQEVVETINWDEIISKNVNLQRMSYIFNTVTTAKGVSANMITLYNKDKFTLIATKVGNLAIDKTDGRPYQILYLNYNLNNQKYIIINLHNGKSLPFHKDALEQKFSKFINDPVSFDSSIFNMGSGSIKLNEDNQNLIKIIGNTIPHVICFGDFNDGPYQYNEYYDLKKMIREGKTLSNMPYSYSFDRQKFEQLKGVGKDVENYWQGLQLFKNSGSILENIIVNTKETRPPNTCCTGKEFLRGEFNGQGQLKESSNNKFSNLGNKPFDEAEIDKNDDGDKDVGDYILISNDLNYHTFITAHNVGATSDHKPVTCKIKLRVNIPDKTKSEKKYISYKNKYLKLKEKLNSH